MFNTVVAILVGLTVANLIRPGDGAPLAPAGEAPARKPYDLVEDLLGKLPGSVVKPFVENDILGIIVLAVAVGVGLRVVRGRMKEEQQSAFRVVEGLLETGMA